MEITVIGSGTCVPSLRRAAPCVLADTGSETILLDTGPGSIRQLLKAGITINAIDVIVYSHFHADHTADMVPFIFASKYSPGTVRNRDLTIIGPPGLQEFYQCFIKAYGHWIIPEHFVIHWIEAESKSIEFPSFIIKTAPTLHSDKSMAVRVESKTNASVVYSGDSDYCESLVSLAHNADLLILECAFPEHMKCEGHLIPSLAGKIAGNAHCKRLLLTHFYPPCDEADLLTPLRTEFSGEVLLAEDLMKITV
jgi:ribonuclease BN (tRNA processing enzyme)